MDWERIGREVLKGGGFVIFEYICPEGTTQYSGLWSDTKEGRFCEFFGPTSGYEVFSKPTRLCKFRNAELGAVHHCSLQDVLQKYAVECADRLPNYIGKFLPEPAEPVIEGFEDAEYLLREDYKWYVLTQEWEIVSIVPEGSALHLHEHHGISYKRIEHF